MAEGRGRQVGLALVMAADLLGACAAGGPLPSAPAPADAPITMQASDGSDVAASEWLPDGKPTAVILALHGFGDYGRSTFSISRRGHGAGAASRPSPPISAASDATRHAGAGRR